jgi:hypothetical protein
VQLGENFYSAFPGRRLHHAELMRIGGRLRAAAIAGVSGVEMSTPKCRLV